MKNEYENKENLNRALVRRINSEACFGYTTAACLAIITGVLVFDILKK